MSLHRRLNLLARRRAAVRTHRDADIDPDGRLSAMTDAELTAFIEGIDAQQAGQPRTSAQATAFTLPRRGSGAPS